MEQTLCGTMRQCKNPVPLNLRKYKQWNSSIVASTSSNARTKIIRATGSLARYQDWHDYLKSVARFCYGPEYLLKFEQFMFKPPWWKPKLYHRGKPDEAKPVRFEKTVEVGHAYRFYLNCDKPNPGLPKSVQPLFACTYFKSPITLDRTLHPDAMVCPCPAVAKIDEALNEQRLEEQLYLRQLGSLLVVYNWAYEFNKLGQLLDAEISEDIFSSHGDFLFSRYYQNDVWEPDVPGFYWPAVPELRAVLDRMTAQYYQRWYGPEGRYLHLDLYTLCHYFHPNLMHSQAGFALTHFNLQRDEELIFAELGVNFMVPADEPDNLQLIEALLIPAVDAARAPVLSVGRMLGLGKKILNYAGVKLVRKHGLNRYFIRLPAPGEKGATKVEQLSQKEWMTKDKGALILTNKRKLLLYGRDKISVFATERMLIEQDSPNSFVIKVINNTTRLQFVTRMPETWRTLFEAQDLMEKHSNQAELSIVGEIKPHSGISGWDRHAVEAFYTQLRQGRFDRLGDVVECN